MADQHLPSNHESKMKVAKVKLLESSWILWHLLSTVFLIRVTATTVIQFVWINC